MAKIFSFCIYGSQKKYCLGMIKNIVQITELFPDFEIWIAIGNDVPRDYIEKYETYKNVRVFRYETTGGRLMSYRFLFIDTPEADVMFVRDADSRFGDRDIYCINDFLMSNYKVFTIRDHPYHGRYIMGGMWGMKKIENFKISDCYSDYVSKKSDIDAYQSDQIFLENYVYPKYESVFIAYTDRPFGNETNKKIQPSRKDPYDFCGNVVLFDNDENEYYEFKL
jgi:hypothetical protein